MSDGWVCPRCGAVGAPFMPSCSKCNVERVQQTFTDNVTPCPHTNTYDAPGGRYCFGCGQFVQRGKP